MYITAPERLQEDFELVCKNAIIFNMPKEKIYKEALRLLLIVREKFQKYMDILIEWKNTELAMEEFIQRRSAGEEPPKVAAPPAPKPVVAAAPTPAAPVPAPVAVTQPLDPEEPEGLERAGKMLRKRKDIDYTKQVVSDGGKELPGEDFTFEAPDPPKRKEAQSGGGGGIVTIENNSRVTLNIGMMEPKQLQSFAVQEPKKKSRKAVHTADQHTGGSKQHGG